MNETSKATRRRFVENATGVFPWAKIMQGKGLDVGCGSDRLQRCQGFDLKDGDANFLSRYISEESLDYLHSSQTLEHMLDPYNALEEWLRCLKIGGHAIITVPDWCLYEHMRWPSAFNGDHKSAWSLWLRDSPCPKHIYVPQYLQSFIYCTKVELCRLVDTNYDYKVSPWIDQTKNEEDGVEAFIEFVLRRTS